MAKQSAPKDIQAPTVEIPLVTFTGKFQCTLANRFEDNEGKVTAVRATLQPETGENPDGTGNGNESWSTATPNGVISLAVTSENMYTFFEAGKQYAITITPIEETGSVLS